ncbi:uncharacterized protein LOC113334543 [Papaver somniferum]|uniref:uncharacterized protein LOC113334543 n=1 Tax=Papaver somniferum TaxID=3469 RepID=UPI000E6F5A5E|nr:uncharacterized protein LOC113334543 [Papaver somniferum]
MEDNLLTYCGSKLNSLTLVSELINLETQKLNEQMVRNNFSRDLAETILNIRIFTDIQNNLKLDKLRWLLTNDGKFSVKSMYKKLKNPSVDDNMLDNATFWKAFWKLNISQRIKTFLWKYIHNIFPIRKKLGQFMKDIKLNCVFCNHECESLKHLFFECIYAKTISILPPLVGLNHNNDANFSFANMYADWIAGVSSNYDIEIMATKCWLIWKERCLRVFQSKSTISVQLALAVQRHLAFWSPLKSLSDENMGQEVNSSSNSSIQAIHTGQGWTKPPPNQFKLNFDASWICALNSAGYGLIVRADTGTSSQARVGTFKASSTKEAGALSLLESAKWDNSMNLKDFWVEGDCQILTHYAQGKASNIFWRNKALIEEAMKILHSCHHFLGLTYMNRRCNVVDDTLAKETRKRQIHKQ